MQNTDFEDQKAEFEHKTSDTKEEENIKERLINIIESTTSKQNLFVKLRNLLEDHGAATDYEEIDYSLNKKGDVEKQNADHFPHKKAHEDFPPFSWRPSCTPSPLFMTDQPPTEFIDLNPEAKNEAKNEKSYQIQNANNTTSKNKKPSAREIDNAMEVLTMAFGNKIKLPTNFENDAKPNYKKCSSKPNYLEEEESKENLTLSPTRNHYQTLTPAKQELIKRDYSQNEKQRCFQSTYVEEDNQDQGPCSHHAREPSHQEASAAGIISQARSSSPGPSRVNPEDQSMVWGLPQEAASRRSSLGDCWREMSSGHAQIAAERKKGMNINTSQYRYASSIPIPYCEYTYDFEHGQQQAADNFSHHSGNLPSDYIKLKLDGSNLQEWSQQLQVIYLREGMLFFINNPPNKPWTLKVDCLHHKAYYIIIATISPSIYPSLQDNLTVSEIFQKMYNIFYSKSVATTTRISREFYSAKLKDGIPMSEHILKLNATRADLIQRGENISDCSMKSVIINSLDPSWDNYITLLDSLSLEHITLETLTNKLIAEDNLRKERSISHREGRSSKRVESQNRDRYTTECHTCGSRNHYTRDCPKNIRSRDQSYYKDRDDRNRNLSRRYSPDYRHKRRDYSNPRDKKIYRSNSREGRKGSMYRLGDSKNNPTDSNNSWLIDSGATNHTTNNKQILSDFNNKNYYIKLANQDKVLVKGIGNTYIEGIGKIEGVLYIPDIPHNILSTIRLTEEKEIEITFRKGKVYMTKNETNIGKIIYKEGLTYLQPENHGSLCTTSKINKHEVRFKDSNTNDITPNEKLCNGKPIHDECTHLLHRKLGHASFPVIQKMLECTDGTKVKNCKNYLECSVCKSSKIRSKPRPKKATRTTQSIFQLVHMDLVGPLKPSIKYKKKYFLTIVDDFSRYGYVYTLNNKHETFKKFKEFYKKIETQHNIKIKQIMTDRGSEFLSREFSNWLKSQGILHFKCSPQSAFQNGVAERRNGLLQTMVRCVLDDAGLGQIFWAEALTYSNYTINRTWSSVIGKTPYEVMYNRKPKIGHLHVFGVTADVYIPKQLRRKGEKVSKRLRFMGYESGTKGYRFIDKNNRFVISRTATFHEHTNWSRIHLNEIFHKTENTVDTEKEHKSSTIKPKAKEIEKPIHQKVNSKEWKGNHPIIQVEPLSEKEAKYMHDADTYPNRPIRSNRNTKPKKFDDYVLSINANKITPNTYEDILKLPKDERELWELAMKKEMDSLKELNVYTPAQTPEGKTTIGTRWIFKIKELEDNKFLYKARLVAQGFAQRFPDDYVDTYSPTVRSESVKSALVIASILDLDVYQFDVQTAYLHAKLDKEIYVRAPPGKDIQKGETWLLNKSLYGLRQSGKRWYECLSKILNEMGFSATSADLCFFVRKASDSLEYVLIYVDDILYFGKHKHICDEFAKELNKHFTLKSLGKVNKYLGVQIDKTKKGFKLSQKEKILELLERCNMMNSKPCESPMQVDFTKNMYNKCEPFKDNTLYRSVIGSLLYISNWTRPDIALAINLLSRHVSNPNTYHWEGIKRVLRYLKFSVDACLYLEPTHSEKPILTSYADADWAGDTVSRKSTSGYVFLINNCPVYWYTGKQNLIATSTAESEYICLSKASNNLTWFDDLLSNIWVEPVYPIIINEDNKAAIDISTSEAIGQRSRHIDIKYKHVRQLSHIGFIKVVHCETSEQIADILTKPLPVKQHAYLTSKLNVHIQNSTNQ